LTGCFRRQGAGQPISVPDKNRLKASPGAQQVQEHSSTIDLPPGKPNASKEQNHMNPVKHQVIVLVGSGAIGQAIARRVGMGHAANTGRA